MPDPEFVAGPTNRSFEILPTGARTADTVAGPFNNFQWRGLLIVVDVTAITATPIVTIEVRVRDENGDYNEIIYTAGVTFTATGEFSFLLYPGILAADFDGTEASNTVLPLEYDINFNHTDADSITYSARGHYIL